ncbi:type 1 glutamine amidotransferase [bacterium]|nr:type 1 glutamine amidotransferase [bacterium]
MRIHIIQHVAFEEPGEISNWINRRGHALTLTRVFRDEEFPEIDSFDLLIIMGGPMSVNDHASYPWIANEKKFISQALAAGKYLFGICLGAQFIASALGAKVYPNKIEQQVVKEIGWFPVKTTPEALSSQFFCTMPGEFSPLHWHGETFDLPQGAIRLASTSACANQAFEYNHQALGIQFHLEMSPEIVREMLVNCENDFVGGRYEQSPTQILEAKTNYALTQELIESVLDRFENKIDGKTSKNFFVTSGAAVTMFLM